VIYFDHTRIAYSFPLIRFRDLRIIRPEYGTSSDVTKGYKMLAPNDVREIREGIYHSQPEFADLLGRLRGVPISHRTIEAWELGQMRKLITLYNTDLAAIKAATTPQHHTCQVCRAQKAIVRKCELDMCANCATPETQRDRRLLQKQVAVCR